MGAESISAGPSTVIDDCPWKRVLEVWPDSHPSLADAAIAALAAANRYDAVATFDRKLAKRVPYFGVSAYWSTQ